MDRPLSCALVGVASSSTEEKAQEEGAQCRLCWSEADDEDDFGGGELVSPCLCSGGSRYIHQRCLHEWQATLRRQSLFQRANRCEVCKAPYRMQKPQRPLGLRRRLRAFVRRLSITVLEVFHSPSWVVLAFRSWKSYVFMSALMHAGRWANVGLRAGVKLGHSLVAEQTTLMVNLLSTFADLMGSPCAELLWCQAAATVCLGLASEFAYASLLGLASGALYGFATGYVGAVRGTFAGLAGLAGLLGGAAGAGLRHAAKVTKLLRVAGVAGLLGGGARGRRGGLLGAAP
ncbi:hypothetical protein FOA52_000902 [Chlamydomonas sp. UWO 241]|nr:hypothetical protein FOA52_000902 [Chlamydomonas sp. UWO 241]